MSSGNLFFKINKIDICAGGQRIALVRLAFKLAGHAMKLQFVLASGGFTLEVGPAASVFARKTPGSTSLFMDQQLVLRGDGPETVLALQIA